MNLLDIRISASRRDSAKPQAREPAPVLRHEGFGAFYSSRVTPTQRLLLEAHRQRRQKFFAGKQAAFPAPLPPPPEPPQEKPIEPVLVEPIKFKTPQGWTSHTKVRFIQKTIVKKFNATERVQITVDDLICPRRFLVMTMARHMAIYFVWRFTAMSLPAIGRKFGNRDHTSVLHAKRKIERLMLSDSGFAQEIAELTEYFEQAFAVQP